MRLYEQLQEKLEGHIYNGYFTCLCQFHDDRKPSMFVYSDGWYICKSCGAKGTLEKLNRHLGGFSVNKEPHSNTVLPKWRKWEENWGDLTGIAKHAHLSLKRYPEWNFYFKQRKIEQFVEPGLLGYIDGWATFPVFDEKRKIVSIIVRDTKNKSGTRYVTHSTVDGKQYLYVPNYERVSKSDYVVLCYGIVDAWSYEDIEIPVVTGCAGQFSNPELLRPLHKKIYIVPDMWEEESARKLANSLGWRASVLCFKYPDDCKDSDDIRMKHGKDVLLSMIKEKINGI